MSKNSGGGISPFLTLIAVIVVGALLLPLLQSPAESSHDSESLPPMMVEGWLNTPDLAAPELEGKVVALDCWATWCQPCMMALPKVADIYDRHKDNPDLVVVGVSSETMQDAEDLANFQGVVNSVDGFEWPVAYGGRAVFESLNVRGIPTLMVFDRNGQSVYRGHSVQGFERALEELLSK